MKKHDKKQRIKEEESQRVIYEDKKEW